MTEGIDTAAYLKKIEEVDNQPAAVGPVDTEDKRPLQFCPHCYYDPNKDKVHVQEDDQKEFYRCIMALRAFSKVFKLWKGDLEITMTALSSSDADLMNSKLRTLKFEGNELLELSIKLKLLFMCRKIKTMEQEINNKPPTAVAEMDIHKSFATAFVLPEAHIRLLSRTYSEFEVIVETLNREGFDENFYTGGGDA